MNVQLDRVIPAQDYIIADTQAKEAWEKLAGFKIHSDKVKVPYYFWHDNIGAIYAIQMSSALRRK